VPIHLGLDVHKDTISVGILPADQQIPDVERITHDEASIRRLVGRLGDPRRLRACYEAGPTGFELARLFETRRRLPSGPRGSSILGYQRMHRPEHLPCTRRCPLTQRR
jgi:hypothetical protein